MWLVLYLRDDVTSWRHVMTSKTGCTLSQLVEVLEWWFFFCFYSFPAWLVWKCHCFCACMMSWRDVMTSQNSFLIYQLVDVLKWWYICISVDISVDGFRAIILYVLTWCSHVITWRHDVTKITTWRQETNCFHLSLQMCARADFILVSVISLVAEFNLIIVVVLAWWNNVTK